MQPSLYLSGQFVCMGILVSSIRQGWEYAALAMVIPVAVLGYLTGKKSKGR